MSSASGLPRVAVASLYQTFLVTRHTGRVVRLSIEELASGSGGRILTVLDFRDVQLIDFSCADEVVAKLALHALPAAEPAEEVYYLFRGMDEPHLDPVESALARRGLAVAAETRAGEPLLVGVVEPEERRVWEAVATAGRTEATAVARTLALPEGRCRRRLDGLERRRLLLRQGEGFVSLSRMFRDAGPGGAAGPSAPGGP